MEGYRATAQLLAARINAAVGLLDDGVGVAEAVRVLADRFGVSTRQARRYVEAARDHGAVAVPEPTVVVTLRLPARLLARLRAQAVRSQRTLGCLVAQAVTELLDRPWAGRGDD